MASGSYVAPCLAGASLLCQPAVCHVRAPAPLPLCRGFRGASGRPPSILSCGSRREASVFAAMRGLFSRFLCSTCWKFGRRKEKQVRSGQQPAFVSPPVGLKCLFFLLAQPRKPVHCHGQKCTFPRALPLSLPWARLRVLYHEVLPMFLSSRCCILKQRQWADTPHRVPQTMWLVYLLNVSLKHTVGVQ